MKYTLWTLNIPHFFRDILNETVERIFYNWNLVQTRNIRVFENIQTAILARTG